MADFLFPTSRELLSIEPEKSSKMMEGRVAFDIMPVRSVDAFMLTYEQQDNIPGLQYGRGLNGPFQRVAGIGAKQYDYAPGVYGEYMYVDEKQLATARALGKYGPIDVSKLVAEKQDQLMERRIDRMEWAIWQLLTSGVITVINATGHVMFSDTFPVQTFTAATPWSTLATATPLANIRSVKMLARGKGARFNSAAKLYVNQTTANLLLGNANAGDIGGKRTNGGDTVNSIGRFNEFLLGDDMPAVVVYEDGYRTEAGVDVPFIPDNKAVLVGSRIKGRVGEFLLTSNANNQDGAAGPYQEVIVEKGPVALKILDGFNGGPCLYYPGSVVVMNV